MDAVASKTDFQVKYFYAGPQYGPLISDTFPRKMTITRDRFLSNDYIFEYINDNTNLIVLKQKMEFVD